MGSSQEYSQEYSRGVKGHPPSWGGAVLSPLKNKPFTLATATPVVVLRTTGPCGGGFDE